MWLAMTLVTMPSRWNLPDTRRSRPAMTSALNFGNTFLPHTMMLDVPLSSSQD